MRKLIAKTTIGLFVVFVFFLSTFTILSAYDDIIYQAQNRLNELGYNPGPLDGLWGKKSESAIKAFQRDNGLSVTGKLDAETVKQLGIEISEESKWAAKQREEDIIVKKLMQRGVEKERFRLSDILPRSGVSGRMTVIGKKVKTSWGIGYEKFPTKLYPKDMESFNLNTTADGYEFWPTGHGSIWCIIGPYQPSGYLAIKGYTFEGDQSDPITFILMDSIGLVYLHGNGKVIFRDGKVIKLGYSASQGPSHTRKQNQTFSKKEETRDRNELLNDYLTIILYVLNNSSNEMFELAKPRIMKHNLGEARMKSSVTASNFKMVLTSYGTALKFGSNWVDPLPLLIDRRGDFPVVFFRNGAVQPISKGAAYAIDIGEGLEAKVREEIWTFQSQEWVRTRN